MPSFLAIETATDVCSVAVLKEDHIAIEVVLSRPRAHSENLVPMIKEALSYAQLDAKALSGIAVSKGPGSYTGLRIGVSAAKGLAFAHKINLIGVPSLTALATTTLPFAKANNAIVVAFNSRKNEVYLGLFAVNQHARLKEIGSIASLQREEIAPFVKKELLQTDMPQTDAPQTIVLAGEGAALVADCLGDDPQFEIDLIPTHIVSPTASIIATLGAARHKIGQIDDLGNFEPYYLNEFIPKSRKKSIFDRLPF